MIQDDVIHFDEVQTRACYVCGKEHSTFHKRCFSCTEEYRKVTHNLLRAKRLGLPHDLTFERWRQTTQHFQQRCAYCLVNPYQVLEHFIPLGMGGGTTASNCIPACRECNVRKSTRPYRGKQQIPQEAIERVQVYLSRQF
jgi:5-methylcytosine-specific restriction endonuclease McrA